MRAIFYYLSILCDFIRRNWKTLAVLFLATLILVCIFLGDSLTKALLNWVSENAEKLF